MTLDMTPVTPGGSEFTGTDVPSFIQIQADGTNLGEPTVSTLNFGTGMTATRGTGGNANKVTVEATASPGGGADELLVSSISGISTFDGSVPSSYTGSQTLKASADVSWNQAFATLIFTKAGLYAITVMVRLTATGEDVFPTGYVWYGAGLTNGLGPHPTKHTSFGNGTEDNGDRNEQCFSDTFFYDTVDGMSTALRIYAESAASPSTGVVFDLVLNAHFVGVSVDGG